MKATFTVAVFAREWSGRAFFGRRVDRFWRPGKFGLEKKLFSRMAARELAIGAPEGEDLRQPAEAFSQRGEVP